MGETKEKAPPQQESKGGGILDRLGNALGIVWNALGTAAEVLDEMNEALHSQLYEPEINDRREILRGQLNQAMPAAATQQSLGCKLASDFDQLTQDRKRITGMIDDPGATRASLGKVAAEIAILGRRIKAFASPVRQKVAEPDVKHELYTRQDKTPAPEGQQEIDALKVTADQKAVEFENARLTELAARTAIGTLEKRIATNTKLLPDLRGNWTGVAWSLLGKQGKAPDGWQPSAEEAKQAADEAEKQSLAAQQELDPLKEKYPDPDLDMGGLFGADEDFGKPPELDPQEQAARDKMFELEKKITALKGALNARDEAARLEAEIVQAQNELPQKKLDYAQAESDRYEAYLDMFDAKWGWSLAGGVEPPKQPGVANAQQPPQQPQQPQQPQAPQGEPAKGTGFSEADAKALVGKRPDKPKAMTGVDDEFDAQTAHHLYPWHRIEHDFVATLMIADADARETAMKNVLAFGKVDASAAFWAALRDPAQRADPFNVEMREKVTDVCWAGANLFMGPKAEKRGDDPTIRDRKLGREETDPLEGLDTSWTKGGLPTPESALAEMISKNGGLGAEGSRLTGHLKDKLEKKPAQDGAAKDPARQYDPADWGLDEDGKTVRKGRAQPKGGPFEASNADLADRMLEAVGAALAQKDTSRAKRALQEAEDYLLKTDAGTQQLHKARVEAARQQLNE